MKNLPIVIITLMLSACSLLTYNVTVMPRGGGVVSHGTASRTGSQNGTINIIIGEKLYSGTWVASSLTIGNAILQSSDGGSARCEFQFSGSAGFGVCQDDKKVTYDMQITRSFGQ